MRDLFDYLVFVGAFFFIGVILLGTMAGCVHYQGIKEDQLWQTFR